MNFKNEILTVGEIRKRIRSTKMVDISPKAITYIAKKCGYSIKRVGGKIGYHKSVCSALERHYNELVAYDKELKQKATQKQSKQQNREYNHFMMNGEKDNVDYEWEKNEGISRALKASINAFLLSESNNNSRKSKLTVLWLDDQRDPYKYLSTKSTSNTFKRNKQFYEELMNNYDVDFVWVKNIYQFISYIEKNGLPMFISFDHDLNNRGGGEGLTDEEKLNNNGMNCAKWLANYCRKTNCKIPKFYIHSANPKHGPEMQSFLDSQNNQ